MSCAAIGCDSHAFYYALRELRDAVLDYERGIITLKELVDIAEGRGPA